MKKDDMIINIPLECTFLEPCELLQRYQFEKNIQVPNDGYLCIPMLFMLWNEIRDWLLHIDRFTYRSFYI